MNKVVKESIWFYAKNDQQWKLHIFLRGRYRSLEREKETYIRDLLIQKELITTYEKDNLTRSREETC